MRMDHFLMLRCPVNTALYLVSEICIKDWEQVLHGNRAALREMWRMAGIRGAAQHGSQFIRLKVFHHHRQGAIHILND